MSPPPSILGPSRVTLAIAVAGSLIVGFVIGRMIQPKSTTLIESVDSAKPVRRSELLARGDSSSSDAIGKDEAISSKAEGTHGAVIHPDPIAQLRAKARSNDEFGQMFQLLGITSQLSVEEIPGVLAYANTLDQDTGNMIALGALSRWANLDPAAAAEWTRLNPTGDDRRGAQAQLLILTEWAARDPVAAKAWLDQLKNPGQRMGAVQGYVYGLATRDPSAALLALQKSPEGGPENLRQIFGIWAQQDPQAAAAAGVRLTNQKARRLALDATALVWAEQAPRDALNWALQLPDSADQLQLASSVLGAWAQHEPQQAMTQLAALPAEFRDAAARSVIGPIMRRNFEAARRLVDQFPPGTGHDQAAGMIVGDLAYRNPAAAAEYAANLPAGEVQEAAWESIASSWSQRDPKAAAHWLEQLPAGGSRDTAAASFANAVRSVDPASAMEWAVTVTDLNKRESAVRAVLQSWQQKDPAAARAWLEKTTTIGPDLRSVLLRAK